MPEPLPEPAPAEEPAATSVEANAPGVQSEVESGSTQEAVVPASRFNGLMSSFNKMKQDQANLLNELEALRNANKETPTVSADLQEEVAALRQELREERLASARAKILDEFPEAKPLADLINADTPEGLRSIAKDISDRLKGLAPAPATETTEVPSTEAVEPAAATPAAPEPSVHPGGAVVPDGAPTQERIEQAIQKRSWTDYLAAKWDRLGETGALKDVELSA